MPFIVQCPHADCRKFMLLEDEARGTTANCLLCSKPIQVDAPNTLGHSKPPSGSKAATSASAPRAPSEPPKPEEKVIVNCPNPQCRSPLKVMPSAKGTKLRCPKCKQVFTA
jgi:hypothetical protein